MDGARDALRRASRIVVLTGAGISAESGIPTFRGPGGIWRTYKAENLATPEAFARNPKLVWEWYAWRRSVIAGVEPNAGHRALAELERKMESEAREFTLITQNVDGLHTRAGSRKVLKVHGDIWTLRCTGCGREREDGNARLKEVPPRCECGAMERPGVVWFGEGLPPKIWMCAQKAAIASDILLVVGTSARGLSRSRTRRGGEIGRRGGRGSECRGDAGDWRRGFFASRSRRSGVAGTICVTLRCLLQNRQSKTNFDR